MEDEQQSHGIVEKFFFTRERVMYNGMMFEPPFVGWVECERPGATFEKVDTDYLELVDVHAPISFSVESCKAPAHRCHILPWQFFVDSRAEFFDDLDELKDAWKVGQCQHQ